MTVKNVSGSDSSGFSYHISATGTYSVKVGAGYLLRVIFGSLGTQYLNLYDGDDEIACIGCKDAISTFEINAAFKKGLMAITEEDFDVTIIYT